jgi:hypothetical protein
LVVESAFAGATVGAAGAVALVADVELLDDNF